MLKLALQHSKNTRARLHLSHAVGEGLGVLKGVGFFLAWSGLRAGRPRSQRSAYWERERLARMEGGTPCLRLHRQARLQKTYPFKTYRRGAIRKL